MYNKYNDILNESKQNLMEMAEKLSKIIDDLNNLTQPVINHLILCLLFSDNQNINHGKKEVYNFIYKIPKDSKTNKYPEFDTLKKFAIDNWADTLDNNLDVYIDNIIEDENLIRPNDINNNKLTSLILYYFTWLYRNLSELGIMQRSDVYSYIDSLISNYKQDNIMENYQKGKEYNIKYLDSDGKTKEIKLKPEEDMSTPKLIKKLQNEDTKFLKLLESKTRDGLITTYKVSFYVDDINTPYEEIKSKLEKLLQNSGLASFKEDIEVEEYNKMDESKELLLEDDNNTINSEKGFFIGDPCYVLSDERYDIWGNEYGYTDGRIKIEDYFMLVHGTAFGDGEYFDEQGSSYGVDSGTIAVVPLELVKQDIEYADEGEFDYGRIVFGKEATLNYEDGFFYINIDNDTEVVIDTDPREEEYGEDDEDFDEEAEDSYDDEEWY